MHLHKENFRHCANKVVFFVLDPLLTQNTKKTGRVGWKQRKIRRANGGKKHKLEPKQLRFCFETTYGPEGYFMPLLWKNSNYTAGWKLC